MGFVVELVMGAVVALVLAVVAGLFLRLTDSVGITKKPSRG
jgi:hypothetical protein